MLQSSRRLSIDMVRLGDDALVHQSDFVDFGELWRTDGTAAGTRIVRDDLISGGDSTAMGGKVLFTDVQNPLMVTDGTTAGTQRLRRWPDGPFGSATVFSLKTTSNFGFFQVDSQFRIGTEMWVSDGTPSGTQLLKDINPGPGSSFPHGLARMGERMFFIANDGRHDAEVWRSNGARTGTVRVTDRLRPVRNLRACGDLLYLTTTTRTGTTLWSSSGRVGDIQPVAKLPGSAQGLPSRLTCLPGGLVFTADDGVHGLEPWTLQDGAARPVLHDIVAGPGSSKPTGLVRAGSTVFLIANDGTHGREVWTVTF